MVSSPSIFCADALRVELPDYPTLVAPARTHIIVTGPSGSGKSAFCLLLAGILEESEREAHVRLFGDPLDKLSGGERASRIGLVPSDPFLAFTGLKRTLAGELEMIQRLVSVPNNGDRAFIDQVANRLDLADHLGRDPFTLSGGEAVRAALAMALVKRPLLLVLDQMHEQLDPSAVRRVEARIAELLPAASVVLDSRSRNTLSLIEAPTAKAPPNCARGWRIDIRLLDACEASPTSMSASALSAFTGVEDAGTSRQPALLVEALVHSYRSSGFKLGPVDLRVAVGERVALVGPNGSGKSTLLKSIALLERPSFARLEILGADGSTAPPPPEREAHRWAKHALYCFQRPEDQLYLPTVREELAETSRRLGTEGTFDAALAVACELGLDPYLDHSPYDMPRSFRRLVPLAGALAVNPPLLLLDEPTVGLDDAQVNRLIALLVEKRRSGATIFISHDQAFIAAASTRHLDIRDLHSYQGQLSKPDLSPA